MPETSPPRRRSVDAVVLGLAPMLGTGVFLVFAPSAWLAGGWLPLAIVLAGLVAACAAFADADLAARYPGSGAGYRYAREQLAPCAGRLAGMAALIGRTSSAAASALVFGDYVLPGHPIVVAVPLIVVVGALSLTGMRWTVRGAWVLVSGVLAVLAAVTVIGLTRHSPVDWAVAPMPENGIGAAAQPGGAPTAGGLPMPTEDAGLAAHPVTPFGVLTAAGLVFFAFLGFSSVSRDNSAAAGSAAGEERGPAASRLAVSLVLLIPLVSYLLVAAALLHTLDLPRLAMESAPLVAGVGGADAPALGVLVRVAAAAATACALFAALGGVGRTAADMAAYRDLPSWLGAPGARGGRWFSGLLGVAGAVLVVVLANPVAAVAITACCGLVYYAVVNLAALRLPASQRRWPKWTSAVGLPLCLGLAVLLPRTQVVIVGLLLVAGCLTSTLLSRRGALGAGNPGAGPPPRREAGRMTRADLGPANLGKGLGTRGEGGADLLDDDCPPGPGRSRERPLEGSAGVAPDGGNGC